jgi:hypothetical protein
MSATSRPNLFAVISWGTAGTHWLARLLNAHPDVLCVHNLRNKVESSQLLLRNRWSRIAWRRVVGSRRYLRLIRNEGRAYRCAGDVHGVPARDVEDLATCFGERIRFAVLTRHPVTRVRSFVNLNERVGSGIDRPVLAVHLLRQLGREACEAMGSRRRLYFLYGVLQVLRVIEEQRVGPIFTLERLTTERDEVNRLLRHLSQGELAFDPETLEASYSQPTISHSPTKQTDDPAQVFASFEPSEQATFRQFLLPEARKLYEELGYDLSFL